MQSYVTLRVPLHVSYVFHSPVGAGGWQHFDLQSELRLTFVYDTAILWRDGIGSPAEAELQGKRSFLISIREMYSIYVDVVMNACGCIFRLPLSHKHAHQ